MDIQNNKYWALTNILYVCSRLVGCTVFIVHYFSHSQLRKNVPCHQKELSCGLPCNMNLPCGYHRCILPCHKGPCLKEGQSCTQPCTVPRSLCGHNCAAPCHDWACPDTLCKEMVCGVSSTVHCSYRLTLYTVHYFLLRLLT